MDSNAPPADSLPAVVKQPKARQPPSYIFPKEENHLDQQESIKLHRKDEHPPIISYFTARCHNWDGDVKNFDITPYLHVSFFIS